MSNIGRIKSTIYKNHGNSINLIALKDKDGDVGVCMALDQKWNNGEAHHVFDITPNTGKNAAGAFLDMLYWAKNWEKKINEPDAVSEEERSKKKFVLKRMKKEHGVGMTIIFFKNEDSGLYSLRKIYLTTITAKGKKTIYGKFDLFDININNTIIGIEKFLYAVESDAFEPYDIVEELTKKRGNTNGL